MVNRSLVALVLVGACGSFEDPDIVIDLRVISMTASPPEQVVDVDLMNRPTAGELLSQLQPIEVCALVADLNFTRRLRWSMVACNLDGAERCPDDGRPRTAFASGILDDPDITVPHPSLCASLPADGNLLGILLDILDGDPLHGLGGLDLGVSLTVGGEDADPALDLFAAKTLRVSPRIPLDRLANTNPRLDHLEAAIDDGAPVIIPIDLRGRCADQAPLGITPFTVAPEQVVELTPVEPDDVRETYVVPTIDGKSRMFTESITYQWVAAGGKFSSGSTGGPRDVFGNPAPLHSDWTAPKAEDLAGTTDIPIWIVQRDERLGEHWYETCIRVAD